MLTGRFDIEPTERASQIAVYVNAAFAGLLILIILWEGRAFLIARRRGQAGSQIHGRLVGLFSLLAVTPAALLAIFAVVTIDRGFDSWFSTRVREIVDNSLVVARAYLNEHARSIRGEILAMPGAKSGQRVAGAAKVPGALSSSLSPGCWTARKSVVSSVVK